MRAGGRYITTVFICLLLTCAISIPVATAIKAVIVSDVHGLCDYVPASNTLTRGSTLKVYTELRGVNYDGFVALKLFFVIKDPRGNVVSMDDREIIRRDYQDDVYIVYEKPIPSWWLYGDYTLNIYAYNRLDKVRIEELERKLETMDRLEDVFDDEDEFDDLKDLFEAGSGADDMDVLKSIKHSLSEITTVRFSVHQRVRGREGAAPAATPPAGVMLAGTKFRVIDMYMDKFTVKPNEPVGVYVTVENEGRRGTEKIALVINGEKEAEETVTLDYKESKTIHFSVKRKEPGSYKITIPGTGLIRLMYVEEPSRHSVTGNSSSTMSGLSFPGSKWLWDFLTGLIYNKKGGHSRILLTSVVDLSTHQISLTKVISSFL